MKRTLSLVLVLAMLCTAMLGVASFAEASKTGTTDKLVISQASVQFADTVYLLVAVDYTAVYDSLDAAKAAIQLSIKNTATGVTSEPLSPDASVVLPGHVCFTYKELGAKNMGDKLELTAIDSTSSANNSEVKTYSILEYALKAKGTSASLDAVCDAMIAYGNAAQTSLNWKAKATYDLSKNYGLVVVSGSTEGKVLAEAGASVTFTPDTAKTGANAALYNMSAAKLDSTGTLTVPNGSAKYFFIGDAQSTLVNLDVPTSGMTDWSFTNNETTNTNKYVYFSKTMTGSLSAPSGKENTDYASMYAQLYGYNDSNNGRASMSVISGEDGYIKVGSTGKQSFVWWASGGSKTIANTAAASAGGKFTLAMTLGKDGTTAMPSGIMRVRAQGTGSGQVLHSGFFKVTNSGASSTFYASNGNTNIELLKLNGEEGVQKFATIYIVFDLNNGNLSYYTEDGTLATTIANPTMIAAMNYNASLIDWTQANATDQIALIQRIKVFAGNIFE